ncbi:unnamed protein product [Adineta steineri]|uniref:Cyclin-like domain-containing protein n=1 Tax=Adineta steineri TaxID=433720 RepID=A0A819HVZ2_9BILA|nr:unnamed protein product [Adineta steineri]CAF1306597.1 unnamed protein product [Adineta steineri]CAF3793227.1 unnamed protein product [Adineta steineri]CAF3909672.1 unnamed protein product [Adineta steineri]CAF3983284.1 unnamed protein product [Adineta steineri]
MGAIASCCCHCCQKTPKKYISGDYGLTRGGSNTNYPYNGADNSPGSYDNKIHVSEIYGNQSDVELAPSDNPTTSTYFASMLQQTKDAIQPLPILTIPNENILSSIKDKSYRPSNSPNRSRYQRDTSYMSQKHSNSCSTIYVDDSTVSQPNWKAMIKCVSIAIHSHILHRKSNKTMNIFDEKLHPLTKDRVPDDYDQQIPEQKAIYRFMRILFTAAQLTAECAIVTLVYLERVLSYGELDLCPSNWKRLVLGAIMLASKVWDDQAVWNVDFCQILKDITVHEMNELEREYIQLLQFNVNVGSSIYAKYYFDLRQLAKDNKISFPDELLTKEKAIKLEASSIANNRLQQPLPNQSNPAQLMPNSHHISSQQQSSGPLISLRRSASVEFTHSPRKSLLIIS